MLPRCVLVLAAALSLAAAADRKPAEGRAANEQLAITATVYTDKDQVQQVIGNDLGGYITVVEVRLTPQGGKPLLVGRDDFVLRSDKDGQKCQPFAPSQIAGQGALVISTTATGGGIMGDNNGPVWGGPMGQPGRLGGQGGSIGNTGETAAQGTLHTGGKTKPNPLLDTLKQKVLAEKETSEPLSGLLYFLLEGKHKPKDVELIYRGPAGKLSLRFK